MNIWQSYKQELDCLVHFLHLLAVCWPGAQSARDNHALACGSSARTDHRHNARALKAVITQTVNAHIHLPT